MIARLAAWRLPVARLRQGFDAWMQRRIGLQGTRIAVERRRLFILPTRLGYTFAGTLLLLLVGSLNYGASLGFALSFLLAGCGTLGMLHTYRNLENVVFAFAPPAPVFAGETAWFPFEAEAPECTRWALEVSTGDQIRTIDSAAPSRPHHGGIALPARRRGRLELPRLTVTTRWPLLLFRVWTYLRPAVSTLVYPAPVDHGYRRPWRVDGGSGPAAPNRDEEFAGLREYRPGDPPRRIAWKALARTDELRVKAFEAVAADDTWLDWDSLEGLAPEARLEQLCLWVLEADAGARPYGLLLPGARIAPGHGPEHRRRCLEALALSGQPEDRGA